jgi:hypothetical protein
LRVLATEDDPAKAKIALDGITALQGRLSGKNAVVGEVIRATALYQLGKEGQACAILKDIRGKAAAAGVSTEVEAFFESSACK